MMKLKNSKKLKIKIAELLVIGLMFDMGAATFAHAYDPNANIISCYDSESGYSLRFQYAGNWIEYKAKKDTQYSTCKTVVSTGSETKVLASDGAGYDLLKFDQVFYSQTGSTKMEVADLEFYCEDSKSGAFDVGILRAERIWNDGFKVTTIHTILPFTNKMIKLGYDNNLGQNVYVDESLPKGILCNNLDAPRYEPSKSTSIP